MSTMIERVARAIWNIRREEEDRCDMELEDMGRNHSVWREAQAAIEAMREPTARMVAEGESLASIGIGKASDDEALPRVWRGMVDVALNEKASA